MFESIRKHICVHLMIISGIGTHQRETKAVFMCFAVGVEALSREVRTNLNVGHVSEPGTENRDIGNAIENLNVRYWLSSD